jgi:VanZ family protein
MSTTRVAEPKRDNQSLRGRLLRYGPLLFWMAFISFASTDEFSADNTSFIVAPLVLWLFPNTSPETLALIHFCVRKTAHFAEYALLAVLAARAFTTSSRNLLRKHWFRWSLLLIVAYALLDEYHQSFVPTRTASIYDSGVDVLGGLVALVIYARFRRVRTE